MDIDFSKYDVSIDYVKTKESDAEDIYLNYLMSIVHDCSIPEEYKTQIHAELAEIMRLKAILMPIPRVLLIPKNSNNDFTERLKTMEFIKFNPENKGYIPEP